jgi:hypothetical protein
MAILAQTRAAQVTGTLTIDANQTASATNFQNFNSLITYLTSANARSDAGPANSAPFGVSGPLIVDVVANSGPYTGQVVFPNITGASATNTITINGNGNAIQFAPTSNADMAIVRFNNGDFYHLQISPKHTVSILVITILTIKSQFHSFTVSQFHSFTVSQFTNVFLLIPGWQHIDGILQQ